jgi:broad specificity polyphosphatase/5'/3'-nucleotidase SurE
LSFAIYDAHWTDEIVHDSCLLSAKLVEHLLEIWTPEVHIYNVNIPLFKDVLSTKIFFTRLLENQTGSLFRLLSAEENESHERSAAEAERKLWEEGRADQGEETEWHDDTDILSKDYGGIKRWQWNADFPSFQKFVNEHGHKGGGMTDGWCINQRWASVTPLRAAYQVVDGGAGSIHGGQEIVLKSKSLSP